MVRLHCCSTRCLQRWTGTRCRRWFLFYALALWLHPSAPLLWHGATPSTLATVFFTFYYINVPLCMGHLYQFCNLCCPISNVGAPNLLPDSIWYVHAIFYYTSSIPLNMFVYISYPQTYTDPSHKGNKWLGIWVSFCFVHILIRIHLLDTELFL
jgi:hypothetical protein